MFFSIGFGPKIIYSTHEDDGDYCEYHDCSSLLDRFLSLFGRIFGHLPGRASFLYIRLPLL